MGKKCFAGWPTNIDFFQEVSETLRKILKSKKRQFHINGKYLMDNGMNEGVLMGKVLKKIEEEWVNNNFKLSNKQINEIINR